MWQVRVRPVRGRSGGRVLVWVIGILVVGGMLIAIMLPSLCRPREGANRVKCGSNLRQIGQAISQYAQVHGGQYPPVLAVLVEEIGAEVMICPSSNDEKSAAGDTAKLVAELTAAEAKTPGHKPCLSYVYVGKGLTSKTATANSVVAYEPMENHNGAGTNVLFGDGHVEWVSKEDRGKVAGEGGIGVGKGSGK